MNLRLVVAALLVLPTAAFAQGTQGPFAGLFGRAPERTGTESTTFDLRGSAGAQWDDALLDKEQAQDRPISSGQVGNAHGVATFERQTDRFRFDARSGFEYRQSIEARPLGGTSVDTGLNVSVRPATRFSASGSASYRYSPFFQFHPSFITLDNGRVMPGLPYVVSVMPNTSTGLVGGLASQYSKRSAFEVTGARHETRFARKPEGNTSMLGAHARFTHRLSRSLQLRLGYGRETWRQAALPETAFRQEEIEAGVDFQREFSVWRRTSLGFSTHSVFMRRLNGRGRFRLNGSASLTRRFRRTWEVLLSANRGSEFMAGFTEPVFSDVGSLSVAGQMTDRIETVTIVSGGRGQFGIDGTQGDFFTASAATMLNVAITRRLGVFGQAGFYRYDVPAGVSTAAAVNRLSRRTVMVGLTTWIPLLKRGRGDSDSR